MHATQRDPNKRSAGVAPRAARTRVTLGCGFVAGEGIFRALYASACVSEGARGLLPCSAFFQKRLTSRGCAFASASLDSWISTRQPQSPELQNRVPFATNTIFADGTTFFVRRNEKWSKRLDLGPCTSRLRGSELQPTTALIVILDKQARIHNWVA